MKSNLALTVVFVILTGVSTWKFVGSTTEYMDLEASPTMFDGFLPETVAQINIQRQKRDGSKDAQDNAAIEGLAFVKQEGNWMIADPNSPFVGVPVMSAQIVSDILERIGRIKVTESNVINSKADDLDIAEKEVDDKSGMRIQCLDANKQVLADVYVGRSAGKKVEGTKEAVEGTFVRKEGTKQVVLFEEAFPLDLEAKTWIDKTRRDVSPDQVAEIEIQGKASGKQIDVHFKRDGNKGWVAVKAPKDVGPLKAFSVTEIIGAACRIDAVDILSPLNPALLEQYGLSPKARLHVIIKTKDGKTQDLFVGKRVEGKQDYYAYIGGQLLLSLAEWDVSRYEKEAKDYFDPKPTEVKTPQENPPAKKTDVPGPGGKEDSGTAGGAKEDASKEDASKEEASKEEPHKEEASKEGKGKTPEVDPAKADPAKVGAGEPTPVPSTPAPSTQPAKKD